MNWGNKLLLVFAVFGAGISYMVYRCTQTPVDLVATEYYRDELVYQKVIDDAGKANGLSRKPVLQQNGRSISLQLPDEMKKQTVKGSVLFYCPADGKKDRRLELKPDPAEARQEFNAAAISPGSYTVKISWECGGTRYYTEEPFTIL